MDNLASHQVAGVRQAIEAAGAQLRHLPAYRPDSTPIEEAFAKLKALLRTTAARTVPDLWTAIRNAFTCFKPDECRNTIAAAGFDAHDLASTATDLVISHDDIGSDGRSLHRHHDVEVTDPMGLG